MSQNFAALVALVAGAQTPEVRAPELQSTPSAPSLAAPLRLECDSGPIDSGAYRAHSGPLYADLDGDGKRELLVGNFKGYFQRYDNIGEAGAPELVSKGLLQAGGQDAFLHNW